jgi:DNA-binding MarR family transcriptional regulator
LSSQVSSLRGVELDAWINFLRAHAAVTRGFNAELLEKHGLTLNDFDVLAQLSLAEERALRRVDLAERVLLTPSGITRLLAGLEGAGYVERRECKEDARVTYAVLTDEGYEKLREASRTHLASVRALFSERFEQGELESLASLLGRLPMRGDAACID